MKFDWDSGELGIRTLETLLEPTHFPGVRLRPLGQLSGTANLTLLSKYLPGIIGGHGGQFSR